MCHSSVIQTCGLTGCAGLTRRRRRLVFGLLLAARPRRAAVAKIGGTEGLLVGLGAWHTDARAIDGQRHPATNPPMLAAMFLHQPVQVLPQQRQPSRGPGDEGFEQALVGAHGGTAQHVERPTMRFDKGSREGGIVGPNPDDGQQDQIEGLPTGIAVTAQRGEDALIDRPAHGGAQGHAVERLLGLLGRVLPRILSLGHIARLLKRPRRARWLGWESGIFAFHWNS